MTIDDTTGTALAQLTLLGEAVAHTANVAVFVWDEDRNYVAVNDAACRLTGRTRDELLRMRVGEMSPDGAEPHFTDAQGSRLLLGSHKVLREDGEVEIEWVTCHTTVAGLPYLVSFCWQRDARG